MFLESPNSRPKLPLDPLCFTQRLVDKDPPFYFISLPWALSRGSSSWAPFFFFFTRGSRTLHQLTAPTYQVWTNNAQNSRVKVFDKHTRTAYSVRVQHLRHSGVNAKQRPA